MPRLAAALVLAGCLAWPATAGAGGFATVGLDFLPASMAVGAPWTVELTVLQHGRTPLEGVEPTVWVKHGEDRASFEASPTSRPGVYRAVVRFPGPGRWDVEVDDGFIPGMPVHSFRPVVVTEAPATMLGQAGAVVALLARAVVHGATADRGLQVWTAQGCGSCHAFAPAASKGSMGPVLVRPSADTVRRMVLDTPPGSPMPDDFGRRIADRDDLDALVEFVAAG